MKFILEQAEENITTHSGFSLVGLLVSKTSLKERLNQTSLPGVSAPEISHGDVAVAYLGLLCQGKSDFDSIEPFREEPFFAMALGLEHTPSGPTLRQRLDMTAQNYQWRQTSLSSENFRKESPEDWLKIAKEKGMHCLERPGKDVYLGSLFRDGVWVVFKVIERTVRADG